MLGTILLVVFGVIATMVVCMLCKDKDARVCLLAFVYVVDIFVWFGCYMQVHVNFDYEEQRHRQIERDVYWLETTNDKIPVEEYTRIVEEVAEYNGSVRDAQKRSRSVWWGAYINDAKADALQEVILPEITVDITVESGSE